MNKPEFFIQVVRVYPGCHQHDHHYNKLRWSVLRVRFRCSHTSLISHLAWLFVSTAAAVGCCSVPLTVFLRFARSEISLARIIILFFCGRYSFPFYISCCQHLSTHERPKAFLNSIPKLEKRFPQFREICTVAFLASRL